MYKPSYRHWVKLWTAGWFDGTCRFELTAAQRSIWIDLLVMAAQSRFPGIICSGETGGVLQAYPLKWLAAKMLCDEQELSAAIKLFVAQGRLTEDHGVYRLVNWDKYQSEYQRQSKYRKQPKIRLSPDDNSQANEVTAKSYRQEGEEEERDKKERGTQDGDSPPVTPTRGGGDLETIGGDLETIGGDTLSVQPVLDLFHAVYPESHIGTKSLKTIQDFTAHLSLSELKDAMERACKHTPDSPRQAFSYFCGICWSKIKGNGVLCAQNLS